MMTETASRRMLQAAAPVEAATPPQSPPKPHTDVCNLSCRNGGICQHPKGGEEEEGLAVGIMEPRCNCPDGYLGVLCEIKVRVCVKGSSGKCMNDQTCISENNGQFYHCECDPDVFADTVAGENGAYNLQYCTSVATTWCDGGGAVKSGSNRQDMHYCYNAGKCKSKRHAEYTCDCPPGWSGAHCATPTDMAVAGQDSGVGLGGRLMRFFLVTTLVFTVLMLCAIGCLIQYGQVKSRRRKRKARRKKQERQRRKKGGHRRLRQRRSNGGDGDNEGIEMNEMGNTRNTDSEEESESSSSSSSSDSAAPGSDESGSDDEEDSDEEFEDEHNRKS